jgi:hypothetical protein
VIKLAMRGPELVPYLVQQIVDPLITGKRLLAPLQNRRLQI